VKRYYYFSGHIFGFFTPKKNPGRDRFSAQQGKVNFWQRTRHSLFFHPQLPPKSGAVGLISAQFLAKNLTAALLEVEQAASI
jgi:hypothetical protein